MKKQVAEFVKKLGFQSHYAGSNQVMHVVSSIIKRASVTIATLKSKITKQFGVLNFKIQ